MRRQPPAHGNTLQLIFIADDSEARLGSEPSKGITFRLSMSTYKQCTSSIVWIMYSWSSYQCHMGCQCGSCSSHIKHAYWVWYVGSTQYTEIADASYNTCALIWMHQGVIKISIILLANPQVQVRILCVR